MPAVTPVPPIKLQFFDDNGTPLNGGYLYTYYAGTSTNKATYTDATGATPNANPVVLDSAGRASVYLAAGAYKFVLKDSDGNTIWTEDNVADSSVTTEVDTVDDLKALTTTTTFVRTLGHTAVGDGGGWWFYWDSSSSDSDDGGMVIQPDSLPATGRWIGFLPTDGQLDLKTYGAACDGTTDDITELQACDTYCAANNLIILISDHTYFATDPSLSSKIKPLPGCQLRWGNINPTLDVIIDGNDKTQHFNNNATYVPTLNVTEIYPEWFGETAASHAVTTATIAALSNTKTKFVTDHRFMDLLDADAGADIEGNVDIAGTLDIHTNLDMNSGTVGAIGIAVFDDVSEYKLQFGGLNQGIYWDATNNYLDVISYENASTDILVQFDFDALTTSFLAGGVIVGSPTGGDKGLGTVNATAVYDDNVQLTGYVLDKFFNPDFKIEDWDKKIQRNDLYQQAHEFDMRSDMIFDLDEYYSFVESRKMLPTFEDVESTGNIPSTGSMIQKLWEVVEIQAVHIKQLRDMVHELKFPCG